MDERTSMAVSNAQASPSTDIGVREVLRDTLQLGDKAAALEAPTPLLGHLPELDSMAVASVLAGLEEYFDIYIDDEDISAEIFETFGSLCDFVNAKTH